VDAVTTSDELRAIALTEFSHAGYAGTSLQRIAELAGVSKSAVLYHYASKEALLEVAIGPGIDRMAAILKSFAAEPITAASREAFIEQFVDFLLAHRLEVHMFINQGRSLEDVPVIARANDLVARLVQFFSTSVASTEDRMRFGIALGGAAYLLATMESLPIELVPYDELRSNLISIMGELLAPVRLDPQD
jgi:TetR/AcrR family transcriptional regulator